MKVSKCLYGKLAATIVVSALSLNAWADDGGASYSFLDVTSSSHVYGLGGHNVSLIDDDINLVEQNPGMLGSEIEKQVGINYMRYVGESNFMGARFGSGIGQHSAWALGVQYFGYGSMKETDVEGNIIGDFSASDMAFNVTYARDINDYWRGGINMKVIYSAYESYSAAAIAADLGVTYYNPDRDFSFGVVAKNLGGQVKKFNETTDNLPWDIQAGITTGLSDTPFRLSITATNLKKWKLPYYEPADKNNSASSFVEKNSFTSNLFRHLTFGIEYAPTERFYLGVGYDYRTRTDMSTYSRNFISGFSVCGGLRVRGFGFGVAVAQPHVGGTSLMLNVTSAINELLR